MDIPSLRVGPETLTQILFGSAVITTVINVTWYVISSCLNFIARRVHLRVKSHQFVLGEGVTRAKYEALIQNISGFYCLLIRYGTDDYIIQMASDRERYEGRQQLKVLPISAAFDANDRVVIHAPIADPQKLGNPVQMLCRSAICQTGTSGNRIASKVRTRV